MMLLPPPALTEFAQGGITCPGRSRPDAPLNDVQRRALTYLGNHVVGTIPITRSFRNWLSMQWEGMRDGGAAGLFRPIEGKDRLFELVPSPPLEALEAD